MESGKTRIVAALLMGAFSRGLREERILLLTISEQQLVVDDEKVRHDCGGTVVFERREGNLATTTRIRGRDSSRWWSRCNVPTPRDGDTRHPRSTQRSKSVHGALLQRRERAVLTAHTGCCLDTLTTT